MTARATSQHRAIRELRLAPHVQFDRRRASHPGSAVTDQNAATVEGACVAGVQIFARDDSRLRRACPSADPAWSAGSDRRSRADLRSPSSATVPPAGRFTCGRSDRQPEILRLLADRQSITVERSAAQREILDRDRHLAHVRPAPSDSGTDRCCVRLVLCTAKTSSGSGLSPAESSFLPAASYAVMIAFDLRRAQLARLHFDQQLLARLDLDSIAVDLARLIETAVDRRRERRRPPAAARALPADR